jgi:replication factor A1
LLILLASLKHSAPSTVDLCSEGAFLILRNAKIDMFKSSMRLSVDQWGKVEEATDADFEPKVCICVVSASLKQHSAACHVQADNNLSLIEYELVTVPTEQSS